MAKKNLKKNFLETIEIMFKNGVKSTQAAAYNGIPKPSTLRAGLLTWNVYFFDLVKAKNFVSGCSWKYQSPGV